MRSWAVIHANHGCKNFLSQVDTANIDTLLGSDKCRFNELLFKLFVLPKIECSLQHASR